MANERRLIDAGAAIERLKIEGVMRYPQSWGMGLLAAMETLRGFPTVDAVETVRCRDCVHYDYREFVCLKIYSDGAAHQSAWQHREPYDYCSYGEAKSGTQPQREDVCK